MTRLTKSDSQLEMQVTVTPLDMLKDVFAVAALVKKAKARQRARRSEQQAQKTRGTEPIVS